VSTKPFERRHRVAPELKLQTTYSRLKELARSARRTRSDVGSNPLSDIAALPEVSTTKPSERSVAYPSACALA
jgi:hypothetical protein